VVTLAFIDADGIRFYTESPGGGLHPTPINMDSYWTRHVADKVAGEGEDFTSAARRQLRTMGFFEEED
jgi:hypothetical protein